MEITQTNSVLKHIGRVNSNYSKFNNISNSSCTIALNTMLSHEQLSFPSDDVKEKE